MLGINWPFSSDVLSIGNPAFTFVAHPYRLMFAATITIPFLSFKNRATLMIDGQNSYGVSVRQLLCFGSEMLHSVHARPRFTCVAVLALQLSMPVTLIPNVILNPYSRQDGLFLYVTKDSFIGTVDANGESTA